MSNDKQFIDFKKEVEKLKEIDGAEKYAKQLAHLFLGNGLSLQTILLLAIDFGQQHPSWIPVEERLPEKDGKYLFYDEVLGHEVSIYYDGVTLVPSATHWMPLPAAPVTHWMPLPAAPVTHWMPIVPPRKEDKMKPLSEEELTKCAEDAWQKTSFMEGGHRAFIAAYKHGYAKCVEQMQNEFNELLVACNTALKNQTNVDTNEIIHQMKGGEL